MSSLRNKPQPSSSAERLLAAARESILAVGWKRTTLTDVAARADLSRMTVYRTYSDMATLLADLMTHEWTQVVGEVVDAVDPTQPWPDRIAQGVTGTVQALRSNDLFRRMVDVDPEWVLPYLIDRRGRAQDAILERLVERLSLAQADRAIRSGDPMLIARTVILTAHGFTISAPTMADAAVSLSDLDAELTELIRRYLQP
jgi:AcrR family transcriptional regulator